MKTAEEILKNICKERNWDKEHTVDAFANEVVIPAMEAYAKQLQQPMSAEVKPIYKGKGEHSVSELEKMIEQYREELHLIRSTPNKGLSAEEVQESKDEEVKEADRTICTSCGVPNILHGSCCGWNNAHFIGNPGEMYINDASGEEKKRRWENAINRTQMRPKSHNISLFQQGEGKILVSREQLQELRVFAWREESGDDNVAGEYIDKLFSSPQEPQQQKGENING